MVATVAHGRRSGMRSRSSENTLKPNTGTRLMGASELAMSRGLPEGVVPEELMILACVEQVHLPQAAVQGPLQRIRHVEAAEAVRIEQRAHLRKQQRAGHVAVVVHLHDDEVRRGERGRRALEDRHLEAMRVELEQERSLAALGPRDAVDAAQRHAPCAPGTADGAAVEVGAYPELDRAVVAGPGGAQLVVEARLALLQPLERRAALLERVDADEARGGKQRQRLRAPAAVGS